MTDLRDVLSNYVEQQIGNVRFGGTQRGKILGYGDLNLDNFMIKEVWLFDGLKHNLFSTEILCDKGLDVVFRSTTCNLLKLDGFLVLSGKIDDNLYTTEIKNARATTPICLVSKVPSLDMWLWHRRLSHFNFRTIYELSSKHIVIGLPNLKFTQDHPCSACIQGKMKHSTHKSISETESTNPLHLIHVDLCGPMRIASINDKKYVLVIVDDFSRYTWVIFLRTKGEAPAILITFIKETQLRLDLLVKILRSDNGTKFKNNTQDSFLESFWY